MMWPSYYDEETKRTYDMQSRLLRDRIVLLFEPITDDVAASICAQLMTLAADDAEKEIIMYINSPGGSISAGMAIYDTMQNIKPPVTTIASGMAASMGAFLLTTGEKGRRYAMPNAEILIHQPLGGASGQATEIEIAARHILKTRDRIVKIMAASSNISAEEMEKACDRDNYLSPQEALDMGIIDQILAPEAKEKTK